MIPILTKTSAHLQYKMLDEYRHTYHNYNTDNGKDGYLNDYEIRYINDNPSVFIKFEASIRLHSKYIAVADTDVLIPINMCVEVLNSPELNEVDFTGVQSYFIMGCSDLNDKTLIVNEALKQGYNLLQSDKHTIEMIKKEHEYEL